MMRLKYKEISPGIFETSVLKNSSGAEYKAIINYVKSHWKIVNIKRRNVIKEGYSTNKNVLRRAVRRNLEFLGVKLEKEFKPSGYFKTKKVL